MPKSILRDYISDYAFEEDIQEPEPIPDNYRYDDASLIGDD